jgi:hypothetical protein
MLTDRGWQSWSVSYRADARRWILRYRKYVGFERDIVPGYHRLPRWIRSRKQAIDYSHWALGVPVVFGDPRPSKYHPHPWPQYGYELAPRVPDEWPEFGLLDGRRVKLREVRDTLPAHVLSRVVIRLHGYTTQPWKGLEFGPFPEDRRKKET